MSEMAVACPDCGTKNKLRPASSANKTIAIILWGFIGTVWIAGTFIGDRKEPSATAPSETAQIETVSNSSWDGSVYQAERYLKANLKDPDSYESIEWGKVIKSEKATT